MKYLPQPPPDPLPPHEPAGAVAKAALFFSLVACALSGFSALAVYKDGKYLDQLEENLGGLRAKVGEMIAGSGSKGSVSVGKSEDAEDEAPKVELSEGEGARKVAGAVEDGAKKSSAAISVKAGAVKRRASDAARDLADAANEGAEAVAKGVAEIAGSEPTPWDRIREAVVEVRDTIASGDGGRARARLEELREQVARLRTEAGERGGAALESTQKAIEDAYTKFDESRTAASERLKELQLDLAPLARRMLEATGSEKTPVKAPSEKQPSETNAHETDAAEMDSRRSPAVRLSDKALAAEDPEANTN